MATFTADLASLVAPVSAASPVGTSLRYDPLYDTLKELRRQDDPTLPQGVWKHDLKRADWHQVESLASEALKTRSKDLQLAGWLAEAWLHLHGLPGLREGLKLLAALVRQYWQDVHPQPANGDAEMRLAPLLWANNQLAEALKSVPLSAPEAEESVAYDWQDWEMALYLSRLAATDRAAAEKAEAEGKVTQGQFLLSVSLTPGSFYLDLVEQLGAVDEALGELATAVEEAAGPGAMSLARLGDTTANLHAFVERVLSERIEQGELGMDEAGLVHSTEEWRAEPMAGGGGRIASRTEAYRRLAEAAEYL
nr:type VI secretion system protein TssA [Thermoanaerobaculia bacterium]